MPYGGPADLYFCRGYGNNCAGPVNTNSNVAVETKHYVAGILEKPVSMLLGPWGRGNKRLSCWGWRNQCRRCWGRGAALQILTVAGIIIVAGIANWS
jgi:hypothetical protein